MAAPFTPKIVTANDLRQGDVVYFTADETWSRDHGYAAVARNADQAAALLARAGCYDHQVVGPYLADADLVDGIPVPVHFREVFRTRGPSNYFHGKQAEVQNV